MENNLKEIIQILRCDFSFSDIENVDWSTIKNTLSSADSWSICRLGDYFVKTGNNKRCHSNEELPRKGKMLKNNNYQENRSKSNGPTNTEDFDMLDDIFTNQPLFRLMPQLGNNTHVNVPPIIEPGEIFVCLVRRVMIVWSLGDDADQILRRYSIFSIDWFTDNKPEAPLRVIPSKNRHGINDLMEDASVFDVSCGMISSDEIQTNSDISLL